MIFTPFAVIDELLCKDLRLRKTEALRASACSWIVSAELISTLPSPFFVTVQRPCKLSICMSELVLILTPGRGSVGGVNVMGGKLRIIQKRLAIFTGPSLVIWAFVLRPRRLPT